MNWPEKLVEIQEMLQKRGESGSLTQIANLINVSPSTVSRWARGDSVPRGEQRQSLMLLDRTLRQADRGNEDAQRILHSILGAATAGLIGFSLGGVLIAAGLGWLLGGNGDTQEGGDHVGQG